MLLEEFQALAALAEQGELNLEDLSEEEVGKVSLNTKRLVGARFKKGNHKFWCVFVKVCVFVVLFFLGRLESIKKGWKFFGCCNNSWKCLDSLMV